MKARLYRDIANSSTFKTAAVRHVGFFKKSCRFSQPIQWKDSLCVIVPNFISIDQTVAEIWRFLDLFKTAPLRHFGFVCARLDHPQRTFRPNSVYHCTKFGLNRCSSFENTKVLICIAFGLKMPTHGPKIIFADLTSIMGRLLTTLLKGISLGRSTTYEV